MGLLWVVGTLLAVGAILGLVMFATRPPRCRDCGVVASDVEEYELSASPRVLAVAYRCPRCGGLVARRPVGVPDG
jgi:predicted Zn-ribbon and HTH transcriptional regulator